MFRFYVEEALAVGEVLILPDRVTKHIQVLRLAADEKIVLFNGTGGEYNARLLNITRREARCELEVFNDISREPQLTLGLVQSVASSERMDFIFQKGVELGVKIFQPIFSNRSAVLHSERIDKRIQRWKDIVTAACEQCGRNMLPEVRALISLAACLSHVHKPARRYILSPRQGVNRIEIHTLSQPIWLMVGPEGGYTQDEEQLAIDAGWQPFNLGPRVLRSETAALAAIATIKTQCGDFS